MGRLDLFLGIKFFWIQFSLNSFSLQKNQKEKNDVWRNFLQNFLLTTTKGCFLKEKKNFFEKRKYWLFGSKKSCFENSSTEHISNSNFSHKNKSFNLCKTHILQLDEAHENVFAWYSLSIIDLCWALLLIACGEMRSFYWDILECQKETALKAIPSSKSESFSLRIRLSILWINFFLLLFWFEQKNSSDLRSPIRFCTWLKCVWF